MAEYLVIRIGERSDDPVSWVAVNDQGTLRGSPGSGTLAEAGAAIRDRRVIVLVPGLDVVTIYADIPAKGARLLAALPYALEDQLAEDVENLHFAPGTRSESGRLPVAVIARDKLTEWLEALAEAGIHPQRVVPDYHGLAITPNTLSMLVSTDEIMFNDGAEMQFVIPGITPADALATTGILDAAANDDTTPRHLLAYCEPAVAERYEDDWAALREQLATVDVNLLQDGALPRLATTVASGNGVNLLQGEFGERTQVRKILRPWRHAAVLLAGLLVLAFVAKGVDYYRLTTEQAALQAQFESEYRALRPNDTRQIADPVGTVNSLRRSQGGSPTGSQVFLPSMVSLAEAIARNDAARVEAISYRAGVIDVRLTAPDIPTLDRIVQSIDSTGSFQASLQSADNVGDRVNSRIRIREAGS
jgi:general secretion pathway protein L